MALKGVKLFSLTGMSMLVIIITMQLALALIHGQKKLT
jgi:hypothetical protein